MSRTVDLNADLGEGLGPWRMGDDAAMLEVVTSANVACGFHAGDPTIMRTTCERAAARGVAVGAHVAYRDLVGFGRRFLEVDPTTLADEVTYQVGALATVARAAGTRVSYVKPHGALYNAVVGHEAQARAVVAGVAAVSPGLVVLGLPGSALLRHAEEQGLATAREAFADRAYTAEGHLVPRGQPGAVLHDPELIAARCVAIATGAEIEDVDGNPLLVRADSLCVHGDTPGAVAIARAVREALAGAGVQLASFGPSAR